jgi:predicted ATPase/DNA-binding SARP family transcriptional activator
MRLTLFGRPTWYDGQQETPLAWQRPVALLAIIASRPGGMSRAELASMLRPDADPASAAAYLRRNLHRLRTAMPLRDALRVDDRHLRWCGSCDVTDFLSAIAARDWSRAINLHGAPLLEAVGSLGDAACDQWLRDERGRLLAKLRVALMGRIGEPDCSDGERASCIQILTDLDPTDEAALQAALVAANGPASRAAALLACDVGLKRLESELHIVPMSETLRLRQLVQSAALGTLLLQRSGPSVSAPDLRRFAWAGMAAPLVGREDLLATLAERLESDQCRLLSLVGLGGIGKTRLALAAADRWTERTQRPSVRVDLSHCLDTEAVVAALADALGVGAQPGSHAQAVADWMDQVPADGALVLLDNMEQLVGLEAFRRTMLGWLEAAPALRLLTTSREALGVAAETVLPVDGLDIDGGSGAASELFGFHARRLGVRLSNSAASEVRRIAQLVQGHPLAIELAASWLPVMSPAEIAQELGRSAAFLADEDAVLADHRSVRSVFVRSWNLLPERLQTLLAGLTVFANGFDAEAAMAICAASRRDLLALVGKSLLRRDDDGRFDLHPLVHQFAARELPPDRRANVLAAHATCFLERLAGEPGASPGRMHAAVEARWRLDIENLHRAWRTAVEAGWVSRLQAAFGPLKALLGMQSRAQDALECWTFAMQRLPAGSALQVGLELAAADARIKLEDVAGAAQVLDAVEPRVEAAGDRSTLLALRAILASWRGDAEGAMRMARGALSAAREGDDPCMPIQALLNVATIDWMVGRFEVAEPMAREALALAEAHDAAVYRARALRLLSSVRVQQQQPREARELLARSTAAFSALGDDYEVGYNERVASIQARLSGDAELQLRAARRAVEVLDRVGAGLMHAAALCELALALQVAGRARDARDAMRRSVATALRRRNATLMLTTIGQGARLLVDQGHRDALGALAFALGHGGLRVDARSELGPIFEQWVPSLGERRAWSLTHAQHSVESVAAEVASMLAADPPGGPIEGLPGPRAA